MKQTTTEIFIEVEETIQVKRGRREKSSSEAETNQVIEICPHCGQAIFERETIEIEGENKL